MNGKIRPADFIEGILNSYSQVFFATNRSFAIILILVSLIDPNAGLAGLISVIIANITAYGLGFNTFEIKKGLYGFNSLLIGLGIGYYFHANFPLVIIIIAASILGLFFVTLFKGFLQKYGLPYLSLPFLFGLWTVMLSSKSFESIGISERGIFMLNELYGIGGPKLVQAYEWLNNIPLSNSIKIYFNSVGAIFFQFKVLPGILIVIGLLLYSRIAFLLSLFGFYIAYLFYTLLGGNFTELSYTYIGFNYILTAIALGGYFMVPSRKTFLWLLLLIPLVTLITISLGQVFLLYHLSVYSLPFNIVVILFLYALKFRVKARENLSEVLIQQGQPEKNLYSFHNQKQNAIHRNQIPFKLPFYGKWTVSQGHSGEYTHKEDWRFAWDFVINDENNKSYQNDGFYPHDYYCFGKSVIAPGSGTVIEIIDNIPDNEIGKANLVNNWGNTVIIKHSEYLYSSLNHLKQGSVIVKTGENVKCGQKVGEVGNSGRSPYPHLHFQFQLTPYIGSETYNYPISYYMLNENNRDYFKTFTIPGQNQLVSNIEQNLLMKQVFTYVPGQKLDVSAKMNGKEIVETWEIKTTPDNHTYIYCPSSESYAFYINDGNLLYFTHFEGTKNSVLYYFYLGFYKVLQAAYKDVELEDELPQNAVFKFPWIHIQDFLAPFYLFLKSKYLFKINYVDNPMQVMEIHFESGVSMKVFNHTLGEYRFKVIINANTLSFNLSGKNIKIDANIT